MRFPLGIFPRSCCCCLLPPAAARPISTDSIAPTPSTPEPRNHQIPFGVPQKCRPGAEVKNHVVHLLGLSDKLRMQCVPFLKDAGWRDCAGLVEGYMRAPHAMELAPKDFREENMANRWLKMLPDFMRTSKARALVCMELFSTRAGGRVRSRGEESRE